MDGGVGGLSSLSATKVRGWWYCALGDFHSDKNYRKGVYSCWQMNCFFKFHSILL